MADYPACMGAHEVLRRASKGKTLRVRGSDRRRRRRTLPVLVLPILVEGHEDDDARGDDGEDGHEVHRRAVPEEHVDQKEPQKKDAHGLGVADLATGHGEVRFGVVYEGSMGGMCTPKWVFGYMLRGNRGEETSQRGCINHI